MSRGKVFLVGAGPGDPGLITVKGLQCIKMADVIVYDRLASPKLLSLAPEGAEFVYVGKSPAGHAMKQQEINTLLVDLARAAKTVTRLKGGDPFVFGRGGEEALELANNEIEFEIVPGITSAVAVPAYAGIPVTHRGITSSLAVITGNEEPGKEDTDINWEKLTTAAGTLVFLMGMANLPAICGKLMENGLPAGTPVAIIQWGTRAEQRTLVGTLENITARVAQAGFSNPSVIVVGHVVGLRENIKWYEKRPLAGCRVLVTRSREQASQLSSAIEQMGGEAVEFPVIKVEPPMDWQPLDKAIKAIKSYGWVIFTSVNGVKYFFKRVKDLGYDIREMYGVKICAIGPKTREELEQRGLLVDYVPGEYRAEEIAAGLSGKLEAGQRVLLPRADIARKVLPKALRQMGAQVDEVDAYRTVEGAGDALRMVQLINDGQVQIITFTSSSTVKNFVRLLGESNLPTLREKKIKVASIGPITSATAKEFGIPVHMEAKDYTIEGLLQAILKYTVSIKEVQK